MTQNINWIIIWIRLCHFWLTANFIWYNQSHKSNKKYMLFLLENTANWVVVQLLSPSWVRPDLYVIIWIRLCHFWLTANFIWHNQSHKNNRKYMLFLLKTLRIELLYNCYHLLEFALFNTKLLTKASLRYART